MVDFRSFVTSMLGWLGCHLAWWWTRGNLCLHLRDPGLILATGMTMGVFAADPTVTPGTSGVFTMPGSSMTAALYVPSDFIAGPAHPLILFVYSGDEHVKGDRLSLEPFVSATDGQGYLICAVDLDGVFIASGQHPYRDALRILASLRSAIDVVYHVDAERVVFVAESFTHDLVGSLGLHPVSRNVFCGFISMGFTTGLLPSHEPFIADGLPILELLSVGDTRGDNNLGRTIAGSFTKLEGSTITTVRWPHAMPGSPQFDPAVPIRPWLHHLASRSQRYQAQHPIAWTRIHPANMLPTLGDNQKRLSDYLLQQQIIQHAPASQPTMIFAYAHSDEPLDSSTLAENALFEYPQAGIVPLAAAYFHCIALDLSDVDNQMNPLLNASKTPCIIILDRNQKITAMLTGQETFTVSHLEKEMKKHLSNTELASVNAKSRTIAPLLKDMRAERTNLDLMIDQYTACALQPPAAPVVISDVILWQEKLESAVPIIDKARATYDAHCGRLVAALASSNHP